MLLNIEQNFKSLHVWSNYRRVSYTIRLIIDCDKIIQVSDDNDMD